MATGERKKRPTRPPATTREGRENQLVAAAVDLAEKQLREGTASAQVITHYLKLGSTREQLEQERLANENKLVQAKVQQITDQGKVEEMYQKALRAMRTYAGYDDADEEILQRDDSAPDS